MKKKNRRFMTNKSQVSGQVREVPFIFFLSGPLRSSPSLFFFPFSVIDIYITFFFDIPRLWPRQDVLGYWLGVKREEGTWSSLSRHVNRLFSLDIRSVKKTKIEIKNKEEKNKTYCLSICPTVRLRKYVCVICHLHIHIFTFLVYLSEEIYSRPSDLKKKKKKKKEHVIYQIEKNNNIIVIKLNSLEKGAYLEFSEPAVFSFYCDFTSTHLRDEMMISSCLSILRLIITYLFFCHCELIPYAGRDRQKGLGW